MRRLIIPAAMGLMLLAGCGKPSEPVMPETGANMAPPVKAGTVQLSDADKARLLAQLPPPYNTADLANGQAQSAVCRSCHTLVAGGPDLTGPNLYGLFGRKAGSKPGYNYSAALSAAGFAWDAARLDAWLLDPSAMIPGTKMSYLGLKDAKNRTDLIAFLKVQTSAPPAPAAP